MALTTLTGDQDFLAPDYQVLETLEHGASEIVYRALRRSDRQAVLIKTTKREFPAAAEVARLHLEYELLRRVKSDFVVHALALLRIDARVAVAFADHGGLPFASTLRQARPDLTVRVRIACDLAAGLSALHAAQVLHRDLRLGSLAVHPVNLLPTITSLSSGCPSASAVVQTSGFPVGHDLAFISPEQTGRLGVAVGERSDLYSLGVCLYWLFTGALPFSSSDPMELIHEHLAKTPASPRQLVPELPPVLALIVMKLLAKNPDDRYQTAQVLAQDLARSLRALSSGTALSTGGEFWSLDFAPSTERRLHRSLAAQGLQGRRRELTLLRDALPAGTDSPCRVIALSGEAGIGKSSLVHALRQTPAAALFAQGKFDPLSPSLPYRSFCQVLLDGLRQVLAREPNQVAFWRAELTAALGGSLRVLTDLLPELIPIVGEQAELPTLGVGMSGNRFALAIKIFLASMKPPTVPIVLHLDDAQWADSATLELLGTLLHDASLQGVVVLLSYRDKEVLDGHPLTAFLAEAAKHQVDVLRLHLDGLTRSDIQELLAETLDQAPELGVELTTALANLTKGNPFYIFEVLKKLELAGQVYDDPGTGQWLWQKSAIQSLQLSGDVFSLVTERLQQLTVPAQRVIAVAACHGNTFTLRDLHNMALMPLPQLGTALHESLQAQILIAESGDYRLLTVLSTAETGIDNSLDCRFRFIHDRILQAAQALVPVAEVQACHLRLGQQLAATLAEDAADTGSSKLFTAVMHLNTAAALLSTAEERRGLAALNQRACSAALATVAYGAAAAYAQQGLDLLGPGAWQEAESLTWSLHLSLLRALHLSRSDTAMAALAEQLMEQARGPSDRVAVMEVLIHHAVSRRDFAAAITQGTAALRLLGVKLPADASLPVLLWELLRTRRQVPLRRLEELAAKPLMVDADQRAAEQLLMTLTAPVYFIRPKLFPVLVCRMLQISLRYGHAPASTYAYGVFGVLSCAALGDVSGGFALGRFSLALVDKLGAKELKGKVMLVFYASVHHWREPLSESLPQLAVAYQAAIEAGDFEYAALSAVGFCCYSFVAGVNLATMAAAFDKYIRAIQELKESSHLPLLLLFAQATENLRRSTQAPYPLDGVYWQPAVQDAALEAAGGDHTTRCVYHIVSMQLAFICGRGEEALAHGAMAKKDLASVIGVAYLPVYHFYQALTFLRFAGPGRLGRAVAVRQARSHQRRLQRWGRSSPSNYGHKALLISAEIARLGGQITTAGRLYDEAAASAAQHEFTQEEALCHELAGYFYLSLGQRKIAGMYLQTAVETYERWGATAKVAVLNAEYASLLAGRGDGAIALVPSQAPAPGLGHGSRALPTSGHPAASGSSFDTATLVKVSRAILSELSQERLYKNLTALITQNAGAETGRIILYSGETWQTAAHAILNQAPVAASEPVAKDAARAAAELLPVTILRYVHHSQTSVFVHDAVNDPAWNLDPYIANRRIRSLACLPLITQEATIGVLYLENNATPGAFSASQVDLMTVLAAQLAMSLGNARLYETLEHKVAERTEQLSKVLSELQEAQAELIQSEKMASLGAMVAGVAHEINTPLGIGVTLTSILKHETRAITQEFTTGLKKSQLTDYLTAVQNSVEILEKNLNLVASQVAQFKSVAFQDSRDKAEVLAPNEVLQTAITGFRLQYDCRHLEIHLDCAPELLILSYTNALTQITYNLIKNALTHAFDPQQPGRVTISFTAAATGYSFVFSDNGRGISEEGQRKIFDPFYTTARASGNMGLGLHICYNLVKQKLGGRIECTSRLGAGTTFVISLPPWTHERPPPS